MEFLDRDPIYLQISRSLEERILSGEWKAGDRVPSVRDLAITLEVNPNTVARTYLLLQEAGIFENRRGIGYFVAEGGRGQVVLGARTRMETQDLPRLFRSLELLDLGPDDLARLYREHLTKKKESEL